MKDPNAEAGGKAAMYGMAQSIPDRSIVSEIACGYFDAYYCTDIRK
jgi:sphinganine-1-phosphate aldolase